MEQQQFHCNIKINKHPRTISPKDFVLRCNLYATWIHILCQMMYEIICSWQKMTDYMRDPATWIVTAKIKKILGLWKNVKRNSDRILDDAAEMDPADWKHMEGKEDEVYSNEVSQIKLLVVVLGKYFQLFYGKERTDRQDRLFEFMDSFKTHEDNTYEASDDATDIYGLNFYFDLKPDKDDK